MGYSHSLNVPLHKIASAKGKSNCMWSLIDIIVNKWNKVNIMSKDRSPTQTPSCPFLTLTPYARLCPEGYPFCPAWGLTLALGHLCMWCPLHPVWTLILHVWMFPSATTPWIPLLPYVSSDPLISCTPLEGALSNVLKLWHSMLSSPNMDILLPWLGLCHFTLASSMDACLSLPYLMDLGMELFRKRRGMKKEKSGRGSGRGE